jgi:Uma2 family endonuclease
MWFSRHNERDAGMSTLTKAAPIHIDQYLGFDAPSGFRDELIEGEIILSPDPKPLHPAVANRLSDLLKARLLGTPFVVQQRVNFRMEDCDSMPSPDVFVLDKSRWQEAVKTDTYPSGSPILAVEIVSPANRRKAIQRKTGLYLRHGSVEVWVVFPRKQVVEVWTKTDKVTRYTAPETITLRYPFPSTGLDLDQVFSPADA